MLHLPNQEGEESTMHNRRASDARTISTTGAVPPSLGAEYQSMTRSPPFLARADNVAPVRNDDENDDSDELATSTGFHSAQQEEGAELQERFLNEGSYDNEGRDGGEAHEGGEDPSAATTITTDDASSQYIDLNDVLNFLSPSPRKVPMILRRKGNQQTAVVVDVTDTDAVEVESSASSLSSVPSRSGGRSGAGVTLHADVGKESHKQDHSKFVNAEENICCDDHIDLFHGGKGSEPVGLSDEERLEIVPSSTEDEGRGKSGTIGERDSQRHQPAILVTQMDAVPRIDDEEPTPIASNRMTVFETPDMPPVDLDRLGAPLVLVDRGRDNSDIEDKKDVFKSSFHSSLPQLPSTALEDDLEPSVPFGARYSHVHARHSDEHEASTIEMALALLEDGRSNHDVDFRGSPLVHRPDILSSSKPVLDIVSQDDALPFDERYLNRSTYEEALSLLEDDDSDGIQGIQFEFFPASSTQNKEDNELGDSALSSAMVSTGNGRRGVQQLTTDCYRAITREEPKSYASNDEAQDSAPHHEKGLLGKPTESSKAPLRVSLNRLRAASVSTLESAVHAISPTFLDEDILIKSFRGEALQSKNSDLGETPTPPVKEESIVDDDTVKRVRRLTTTTAFVVSSALRVSGFDVAKSYYHARSPASMSDGRASETVTSWECFDSNMNASQSQLPSSLSSDGASLVGTSGPVLRDTSELSTVLRTPMTDLIEPRIAGRDTKDSLIRFTSVLSSTVSSLVGASSPILEDTVDFASGLFSLDRTDHGSKRTRNRPQTRGGTNAQPLTSTNRSLARFRRSIASAGATFLKVGRLTALDAHEVALSVFEPNEIDTTHPSAIDSRTAETANRLAPYKSMEGSNGMNASLMRFRSVSMSVLSTSANIVSPWVGGMNETVDIFQKGLRMGSDVETVDIESHEPRTHPKGSVKVVQIKNPSECHRDAFLSSHVPCPQPTVSIESSEVPTGMSKLGSVFRPKGIESTTVPTVRKAPDSRFYPLGSTIWEVSGERLSSVDTSLPLTVNELQIVRLRSPQRRPPLSPKKAIHDARSAMKFDGLSRILSSCNESSAVHVDPAILQSDQQSFGPTESVFAEFDNLLLSPPGSPPVPSTPSEPGDHEGWSHEEPDAEPVILSALVPTNAGQGFRISRPTIRKPSRSSLQLTGGDGFLEWGASSFSSVASELGVSGVHSVGSKRTGPGRRFSISSRGSSRNSISSRSSRRSKKEAFRVVPRRIHQSLSEDALFLDSGFQDDQSETISTGVHSSSPEFCFHEENSLRQKCTSYPDLQLLGRLSVSGTKEKKIPLTPPSSLYCDKFDRVRFSPELRKERRRERIDFSPDEIPPIGLDNEGLRGMFLPLQEDARLEEALMKFSSLENLDFAFAHIPLKGLKRDVDLTWQQLLACWKHNEVAASRRSSTKDAVDERDGSEADSNVWSTPQSKLGDLILFGLSLDGVKSESDAASALYYTSSSRLVLPHGGKPQTLLRHQLNGCDPNASVLIERANVNLERFTALVEEVAMEIRQFDSFPSPIWYSAEVKNADAINGKAKRKYGGDVLQVKDTLRGRIIFPDEGSLVAGLVLLKRRSERTKNHQSFLFTIVRVKNGLDVLVSGALDESGSPAHLPSGYRHLLVNIRLNDGLLAGEDGYRLHLELSQRSESATRQAKELVTAIVSQRSKFQFAVGDNTWITPLTTGATRTPVRTNTSRALPRSDPLESRSAAGLCPPGLMESSTTIPDSNSSQHDELELHNQELAGRCVEEMPGRTEQGQRPLEDGDFVLDLLSHGSQCTSTNPRDVPSLVCLHGLLIHFLEIDLHRDANIPLRSSTPHTKEIIIKEATKCILRCLAVRSQANSLGMTGWLEYGSSSPFNRLPERQFFLLHDLAACFAFCDRWTDAEAVLQAAIAWCEEHMHPCHPFALVTLLDISSSYERLKEPDVAKNAVSLFRHRSSMHLAELEAWCYQRLNEQALDNWSFEPTFRIESGQGPTEDLESFCRSLQCLLTRRFVSVLGEDHPGVAHHHSLLGDAFSVMANCFASTASMHVDLSNESPGATYWRLAYAHYSRVFRNLDRSPINEAFYSTSFGLARCLHELGHSQCALSLMLTVLSDPSDDTNFPDPCPDRPDLVEETELSDTRTKNAYTYHDESAAYRFLVGGGTSNECDARRSSTSPPGLCVVQASCYWLTAVLSVASTHESAVEGWSRAVACLRSASHLYQRALQCLPAHEETISRAACLTQLRVVEEEARRLISLRIPEGVASIPYASHSPATPFQAWTFSQGSVGGSAS